MVRMFLIGLIALVFTGVSQAQVQIEPAPIQIQVQIVGPNGVVAARAGLIEGKVKEIDKDGNMVVTTDDGKEMKFKTNDSSRFADAKGQMIKDWKKELTNQRVAITYETDKDGNLVVLKASVADKNPQRNDKEDKEDSAPGQAPAVDPANNPNAPPALPPVGGARVIGGGARIVIINGNRVIGPAILPVPNGNQPRGKPRVEPIL
jgi:hypothetical protein